MCQFGSRRRCACSMPTHMTHTYISLPTRTRRDPPLPPPGPGHQRRHGGPAHRHRHRHQQRQVRGLQHAGAAGTYVRFGENCLGRVRQGHRTTHHHIHTHVNKQIHVYAYTNQQNRPSSPTRRTGSRPARCTSSRPRPSRRYIIHKRLRVCIPGIG